MAKKKNKERSYLKKIPEPEKTTGADVKPPYYDEQELRLFPLDYSTELLKMHKEFLDSSEKLMERYEREMGEQYSVLENFCSELEEDGGLDPNPGFSHRLRHTLGSSHSADMRELEREVIRPTKRTYDKIKSVLKLLKEGISYLDIHMADEELSDEVRSNLTESRGLAGDIEGIYKSMGKTTSKTLGLAKKWYDRIEAHCG